MELFNSIVSWVMRKRIHQIELFVKYPHDVQEELLMGLVRKAAKTSYGQRHHFESIQNRRDFMERVPVVNYEGLFPEIDRILQGESNVLWPTEIKWFAKSSGTTNDRSKFIPVSKESIYKCHYRAGLDVFALYARMNPSGEVFKGKTPQNLPGSF